MAKIEEILRKEKRLKEAMKTLAETKITSLDAAKLLA